MQVLIIDQCSGSKDYPKHSPVYTAEDIDQHGRESLLESEDTAGIKAHQLYTGRQQQYIDQAVNSLRESGHSVDRYFVSAGFGLVEEDDELPPYEVTFSDMNNSDTDARADRLNISEDVQTLLAGATDYDFVFFALGSDYYRAVDLDSALSNLSSGPTVILFNRESYAEEFSNVISLSARTEDASEHSTIVIALKGLYLANFAGHLELRKSVETHEDIRTYCLTDSMQTNFDEYAQ